MIRFKARTTRSAGSEKSTSMPGPSRLKPSGTFSSRKPLPSPGRIRHEIHRSDLAWRVRHGRFPGFLTLQAPAGLDAQVWSQLAIDPVDAFGVPDMALNVAQIQETQPEAPGFPGIGQFDKQIRDLFVPFVQLRAVSVARLADGEPAAEAHVRRRRHGASVIRLRPNYPNHIRAIDLVHDKLSNGRPCRMLAVLDEYTREALCVGVAARMGSADVPEALSPLLLKRGKPEYLRSDNGPGFAAAPFRDRLQRVGIQPIRIYPGSPWENGYNGRFNGTLRRERLNTEWFTTTRQARIVIDIRLEQYNRIRHHYALGMQTPVTETILDKSQISGPNHGS